MERTLDCITKQTYKNLEIIVSDNCSDKPEVPEVIKRFAGQDNRIKYYVQEKNLSIVPNFQFLLNKANGEFFMWAADDDNWDLNFIETCVQGLMEDSSVAVCMADLKLVGEDAVARKSKFDRSFMQKNLFCRSFYFVKSRSENKYFFCGLYRTSLIKSIPFPNRWGGDHLFLYETLTKGKFLYIPGKSNCYYFRGGSSRGMASVRKAFNIKSRYYFFDAYILKYATWQFGFKHISFFKKTGLFFTNVAGLTLQREYVLYYIFIKKPLRSLFRKLKRKPGIAKESSVI